VEENVFNRDVRAECAQNEYLLFPHTFPDEAIATFLIANLKFSFREPSMALISKLYKPFELNSHFFPFFNCSLEGLPYICSYKTTKSESYLFY